ncbi:leucine-rich repeat receptor protein kinase HPCA1-like [Zingiber officinale]|uniref:leucine-rich repeat receptor protein kinase HPCA1-like n=1 Tax=Zingiber officinale TaxID=94328 RepID=UPI001C4B0B06|nr:leucine-rich repeat receptor protein kinase HPCA1-like [Zingiber officinale]
MLQGKVSAPCMIKCYCFTDSRLHEPLVNKNDYSRSVVIPALTMVWITEFLLLFFIVSAKLGSSTTEPADVSALKSLSDKWKNAPPSWGRSGDPCGKPWEGVLNCSNSRVTTLKLFNMELQGTLSPEIGNLSQLEILDLSYNPNLEGPIPSSIGRLTNLQILRLIGCKFSGGIPQELGNLLRLTILALNSNQLNGTIPPSLGRLSNLNYLDLADNQLTGTLPISANNGSGLDMLVKAEHFHLNKNQLSGWIPSNIFHPNMTLLHLLLDSNKLRGEIPDTIGLVKTLTIIRLDNNFLNESVPSNFSHLTNLCVLNLANNTLAGPMPNLTELEGLSYLDLSNNSFNLSTIPEWLSNLHNLTTLIIEFGQLHGEVPQFLFSLPSLQEVRLKNNAFNGTLNISSITNSKLRILNFQNNDINSITLSSSYNEKLVLAGNPVCNNSQLQQTEYCQNVRPDSPYNSSDNITCLQPYKGRVISRAPYNSYVQQLLPQLEQGFEDFLRTKPINFSIRNFSFDTNDYLQVELRFCLSNSKSFTRENIINFLDFNTQDLNLPDDFGPSFFSASQYDFRNRVIRGLTIGIAVGSAVAVLIIAGLAIYSLRQRRQARKAFSLRNPFAYWGSFGEDAGDAPQLRGARTFSLDELKKCTNDFSRVNEIGSGGYGKVYRGTLPNGQIVAIKRSEKGSMQGGLEFKTEIELLSRVHHLNLVELVGFCYEKGELLLVYEYISNGTLRDSLSGRNQIQLDWKRRLKIALDSARGLVYLHNHANPPIIHRDVKSSNILLDDNLIAKVADFGLSTLLQNSEEDQFSIHVKGTPGYVDPEYVMTQQLTAKSDVYSLGVVMLELITSEPPLNKGKYIVSKVKMAIDKNDKEWYGLKDMIDPTLLKSGSLDGLRIFVELALSCLDESSELRPTMDNLVKEIEVLLTDYESNTSTSAPLFAIELGSMKDAYDEIELSKEVSSQDIYRYTGRHNMI